MPMPKTARFLSLVSCLVLTTAVQTLAAGDSNAAKAFYFSGKQKMAAKGYSAALEDFNKSLAAEPRYVWSRRERGTCYYYLGDRANALNDYKAYLHYYPN